MTAAKVLRFESEADFRVRLCNILSHEPYCHTVYSNDPGWSLRFSVHRANRRRVDLYVVTRKSWPWHDLLPVIAIETKIARSMGWLVDATRQVGSYYADLRQAEYRIDGRSVPPPRFFLLCTDTSWHEGELYLWHSGAEDFAVEGGRFADEAERRGGWKAITDFCDRILMKEGAAILRKGGVFYCNLSPNGKGPVRRLDLAAWSEDENE